MPLNAPLPLDPQRAIKTLRIVWAAMLFSLIMYAVVLRRIPLGAHGPLDPQAQNGIALMGILTAAVVLYLRFFRITALSSPTEPVAAPVLARQIFALHLFCFIFSETTGLFGFALAFMRSDPKFYVALYLGGVLLMLLCYPQLPSGE